MSRIKYLWPILLLLAAFRAGAADTLWQEVRDTRARAAEFSARQFRVDTLALRQRLRLASLRRAHEPPQTISLPMPDGSLARYRVYESSIMEPKLAARYPEIKTYKVYGIDDPGASGRLDISPRGFHGMLHTAQGRLFIDPNSTQLQNDLYAARTQGATMPGGFSCGVDDHDFSSSSASSPLTAQRTAARISGSFLEYLLAVAATEEYVNAVFVPGPDTAVDQAQAAIVTAINRVNEIYERDLGIRLKLVANNEQLIESGGNVSFSEGDLEQMLLENQAWIDSKIDNYDLGHVFGTDGGGLAFLGSVCDGSNKAQGVSAFPVPFNDPFYIDYVAHEIGHQFNAEHSFNGTSRSCASGRVAAYAVEPGSGSTIMAYAGICGVEDLQSNSDATFHASSIAAINRFTSGAGSCYNQIPAVPANPGEPVLDTSELVNKSIPANTPFVLDAPASDDAGDVLVYQWDQMDTGCPTDAVSYGTDIGSNPLFRSYPPRAQSKRHFPALGTQVLGRFDDAEVLPCHERALDFRVTVRDGKSGQDTADVRLSVQDTGDDFKITNFNDGQPIDAGRIYKVTWEVAGTYGPPINCTQVDIELLTFADNYLSYSVHPLETLVDNIGQKNVVISPNTRSHPRARVRVKCSDNFFYDVSDVDFRVNATAAPADPYDDTANQTFFHVGPAGTTPPACPAVVDCAENPADTRKRRGGGSALDYRWLLMVSGVLLVSAARRWRTAQG